MSNKAAKKLGQLSAKKRREQMGEEAYREYFKKLRSTPPKSISTGESTTSS